MRPFPFLDAPRPLEIAHRGASPDGLENTAAAIERVLGLGYRYVEADVRATRDGVPVLLHDAGLDRVAGRAGRVAELTWAELARARVAGREPVPRLEDVLGSWPELRLTLHVKTPAAASVLADAIRRTAAVDRVCVGAFRDAWVAAVRAAAGPRLCTTLGTRGVARLRLASYRGAGAGRPTVRPAGAPCAQVPPRFGPVPLIDPRFVAAARSIGVHVHAWTINDRVEMIRLLDLGVDGMMTDRADLLRDVLVGRGQWHGRGSA